MSFARSERKRPSDTTTSRPTGGSSPSLTKTQLSASTMVRFLSSGIRGLLEGLNAHSAIAIEESFVFGRADGQVLLDHAVDGIDHLLGRNGGSDDLADGG